MRTIAYFFYDPDAPRGEPATRARLEGDMRRYCQANRHTLEQTFAYPKAQRESGQTLAEVYRFLERQKQPYLVALADTWHLGATPEAGIEALLRLDNLGSRAACIVDGSLPPLRVFAGALAPAPTATAPEPSARAKNIRDAMYRKAMRGEGLGKPPYGYRVAQSGKLEEAAEESAVVRLMFQLYVEQGMGLRNIVRELNGRGHRTRRDANWSMVTIRDILRNTAYVGTYSRFGLHIPQSHASLIDREMFRKAQDLMDSRAPRRRKAAPQPYLLSGLAVCGECGNHMIGVTRRQSWRNKDGQRMQGLYRYYQCQSRTNQSVCQYHTWRAQVLEEAVAKDLLRLLAERPELAADVNFQDGASAEAPQDDRRQRYVAAVQQAAQGTMTLAQLREVVEGLKAPPALSEVATLAPADEAITAGAALLDAARWYGLADERKRQALERWVQRIDVGDKTIRVTLREG